MRLTHPFPSVLDGLVSGVVALVAASPPELAARIGLAMTFLQLGIGTVNDIVDAAHDAGHKAGKPIPAGLVGRDRATWAVVALFGTGFALALTVSIALGVLALVVIAIGLAYDLRLKGTMWSWLPFAVGIPILPVFGWLGAAGILPSWFAILLPVAILAGTALAIGNAVVDIERDRAAGISSVGVALGLGRATALTTLLLLIVVSSAMISAVLVGGAARLLLGLGLAGAVAIGGSVAARSGSSAGRERAWQAEAMGLAVLTAIWIVVQVAADPGA